MSKFMQITRKILGANSEKNSGQTNGQTDNSHFIGPTVGPIILLSIVYQIRESKNKTKLMTFDLLILKTQETNENTFLNFLGME
jgi:hypothetical protein